MGLVKEKVRMGAGVSAPILLLGVCLRWFAWVNAFEIVI